MDPRDFDGFDPDIVWAGHMTSNAHANGNGQSFELLNGSSRAIRTKQQSHEPASDDQIDADIAAGKFGRDIDPTQWEGLPPLQKWFWNGLAPKNHVTTISGDGGGGKSTLAVQLVVAANFGEALFGNAVNDGTPCKSLYLAAEDDHDEIWRRCHATGRNVTELGNVRFVDLVGHDATLADLERNQLKPNDFYRAIKRRLTAWPAELLIVDSLADFFPGNEIDKTQVRQFIGLLKRLCREHKLTVLMLAHPSMSGIANGTGTSGNTAWNNSVRSRLYLETDGADADLRTLTTKKANYGPKGGQIVLRYQTGVFVVEPGTGRLNGLDRNARANKAACTFLELLMWHTERNLTVSPNRSARYAPTVFAIHPNAQSLTKHDFTDAMQRLLDQKQIVNVTKGPASRAVQVIQLASEQSALAPLHTLPSDGVQTGSDGVATHTPITPGVSEAPQSGLNPQVTSDSQTVVDPSSTYGVASNLCNGDPEEIPKRNPW
jgi:RecA-family ATPase